MAVNKDGCIRKKSCQTNLLTFSVLADHENTTDTVYLDFSKVFAKVSYDILVTKMWVGPLLGGSNTC